MGLSSCPMAPPMGLETAMTIVAVVRPLRSNHVSEYFEPRTWKIGWAIEVKSWRNSVKVRRGSSGDVRTWPNMRSAYASFGESPSAVAAYLIHAESKSDSAPTRH